MNYILILFFVIISFSLWFKKRWIFSSLIIIVAVVSPFFLINGDTVIQTMNQGLSRRAVEYTRNNLFFDLLIIEVLLIVLYLIIYLPKDLIKIRDFKRNASLVPISYMTEKKREDLLGEVLLCRHCKTERLQIEEEVYKKGMHYLNLKCSKCKKEFKERIDV